MGIINEVFNGVGSAVTIAEGFNLAKGIGKTLSRKPELSITKFTISQMPPRRKAYESQIDPDAFDFYQEAPVVGSVGSCRLFLRVRNSGESTVAVRAIVLSKEEADDVVARSSFLETPEGGTSSATWWFSCNLDKDPAHFQQLGRNNGERCPVGETDFFTYSSVQIDPGHEASFVVVLHTHDRAYRCSLDLRAESPRIGTYIVSPDDPPEIVVLPLSSIPQEHRYRLNFSSPPPLIGELDPRMADKYSGEEILY